MLDLHFLFGGIFILLWLTFLHLQAHYKVRWPKPTRKSKVLGRNHCLPNTTYIWLTRAASNHGCGSQSYQITHDYVQGYPCYVITMPHMKIQLHAIYVMMWLHAITLTLGLGVFIHWRADWNIDIAVLFLSTFCLALPINIREKRTHQTNLRGLISYRMTYIHQEFLNSKFNY